MARSLKIIVKGKPNYWRWSIYQWLIDYKDILESEYGVVLDVSLIDGENDYPDIVVNNMVVQEPPFEEGYLIEVLKKALDKVLNKQGDVG